VQAPSTQLEESRQLLPLGAGKMDDGTAIERLDPQVRVLENTLPEGGQLDHSRVPSPGPRCELDELGISHGVQEAELGCQRDAAPSRVVSFMTRMGDEAKSFAERVTLRRDDDGTFRVTGMWTPRR